MAPLRVLAVGHVTHDVYPGGIEAGGCAFYAALTYRALGAEVQLATAFGTDFSCQDALAGIQVDALRAGRTTCFRNIYEPGQLRLQRLDARAESVPAPTEPLSGSGLDVIHLAPVLQEVDLQAWSQVGPTRIRALNIQGWIKKPGSPFASAHPDRVDSPAGALTVDQTPWRPDPEALACFDAVCVGAEDLRDQGDLLDRLTAQVPIVTCTHGKAGCEVFSGGHRRRIGVHPAREVDPTGAGDVFAAAFVFGLASGDEPVEAARLASACASIVVEDVGPRALDRLGAEARIRAHQIPLIDA